MEELQIRTRDHNIRWSIYDGLGKNAKTFVAFVTGSNDRKVTSRVIFTLHLRLYDEEAGYPVWEKEVTLPDSNKDDQFDDEAFQGLVLKTMFDYFMRRQPWWVKLWKRFIYWK